MLHHPLLRSCHCCRQCSLLLLLLPALVILLYAAKQFLRATSEQHQARRHSGARIRKEPLQDARHRASMLSSFCMGKESDRTAAHTLTPLLLRSHIAPVSGSSSSTPPTSSRPSVVVTAAPARLMPANERKRPVKSASHSSSGSAWPGSKNRGRSLACPAQEATQPSKLRVTKAAAAPVLPPARVAAACAAAVVR